jgi:hypothetical protein
MIACGKLLRYQLRPPAGGAAPTPARCREPASWAE